jgi:hypothetical protein
MATLAELTEVFLSLVGKYLDAAELCERYPPIEEIPLAIRPAIVRICSP